VVDDKTVPYQRGTYAFDDEGTPSERTVLVEKGILRNYLFDRFHAMKYDTRSTANGRRESFRYRPIPRMSNTMILSGPDDPSRIIASVDDGLLVKKMGGGQVDTVRGDFVFEIQEGYLIEKGAIGPMVRNATMMGNGPKVLMDIDMAGASAHAGRTARACRWQMHSPRSGYRRSSWAAKAGRGSRTHVKGGRQPAPLPDLSVLGRRVDAVTGPFWSSLPSRSMSSRAPSGQDFTHSGYPPHRSQG
jgi:hypothetical protein